MQDQYIEVTSPIPATSAIFGLGERTPSTGMQLLRQGIPITLWTRDQPAADPDENNYGAHPNYLEIRGGDVCPILAVGSAAVPLLHDMAAAALCSCMHSCWLSLPGSRSDHLRSSLKAMDEPACSRLMLLPVLTTDSGWALRSQPSC